MFLRPAVLRVTGASRGQGHEDSLLSTDGRLRLRKGDPGLPSKLLLFVTGMLTVTVAMAMGTALVVIATATADV